MNEFDLIRLSDKRCFDIHREPYDDIKEEMRVFFNDVLRKCHSGGQDNYPYTYLYKHSYDVLKQILDEYFAYYDHKLGIKL